MPACETKEKGETIMTMQRYAVGISYDGSDFCGWQKQQNVVTVQGICEEVCAKIVNHDVNWQAAGRTDAGVHASEMVAHFDVTSERTAKQIYAGMNSQLPRSVRILWVKPVDHAFHARHSALSRSYTYVIDLEQQHRPFARSWSYWVGRPLDLKCLDLVLPLFHGEHDFSSFRASGCQSAHAIREIKSFRLAQSNGFLYLNITANAFVYRMVRKIVGVVLKASQGMLDDSTITQLLTSNHPEMSPPAPAHGLHFMHASYDPCLSSPQNLLQGEK